VALGSPGEGRHAFFAQDPTAFPDILDFLAG
jgi:hypothetical protein